MYVKLCQISFSKLKRICLWQTQIITCLRCKLKIISYTHTHILLLLTLKTRHSTFSYHPTQTISYIVLWLNNNNSRKRSGHAHNIKEKYYFAYSRTYILIQKHTRKTLKSISCHYIIWSIAFLDHWTLALCAMQTILNEQVLVCVCECLYEWVPKEKRFSDNFKFIIYSIFRTHLCVYAVSYMGKSLSYGTFFSHKLTKTFTV